MRMEVRRGEVSERPLTQHSTGWSCQGALVAHLGCVKLVCVVPPTTILVLLLGSCDALSALTSQCVR